MMLPPKPEGVGAAQLHLNHTLGLLLMRVMPPAVRPIVKVRKAVRKNGPCLCGSGRKFKKCCRRRGN